MSIRRRATTTRKAFAGARGHVAPAEGAAIDPLLTHAIRGLLRRWPHLSARGPAPPWLLPTMALSCMVLGFGVVLEPIVTWGSFGLVLIVPFAGITAIRLVAAAELLRRPSASKREPVPRVADVELPTYTVLVPMYDEPQVLPTLVKGLAALDYPTGRLDLVLVLEARDEATTEAVRQITLPSHMRVVLVPPGGPRTKPKALNYALASAKSDLVVVFDAEDRPEPDQLRRAAAAFRGAPTELACVQARLNVFNPRDSFWSRQFALEYSALFDGLLPALERLGLPIPLGGTSNHFRGIA